MRIPSEIDVVVVGAGPAGLAVAACLRRAGVPYLLLERSHQIASAWRRQYDRLHLHTSRGFSALPYGRMPRGYPRYPSAGQVVEYLEAYARDHAVTAVCGVTVDDVRREHSTWAVHSTAGAVRCQAVIVATGTNGAPVVPTWPGLATFPGPVLHSSAYKSGQPFADQDVLVVGFGNSGGEITLDLLEHGARPVVSVRSRVNVVPRDVLGIPVLAVAVPLSKLPARIADILVWPLLRAYYPSYHSLGLRKSEYGPFRQIHETQRIPLLDIGTIREIRHGRIQVQRGVVGVRSSSVSFEGQAEGRFDAIVLATGYRPALPRGVQLDRRTRPDVASDQMPGLYFCGFYVSPAGMLREIGIEAKEIVGRIVNDLGAEVT